MPVLVKLSPERRRRRRDRDGRRRGRRPRPGADQHRAGHRDRPRRGCGRCSAAAGAASPARPSSRSGCTPSTTHGRRPAFRSSAWAASRAAQDCIEFLAAGASLVGIGTSLFADPRPARADAAGARRSAAPSRRARDRRTRRRRPPTGIKLNSSLTVVGANFAFSSRFLLVARGSPTGIIAPYHDNQHPLPDTVPVARSAHGGTQPGEPHPGAAGRSSSATSRRGGCGSATSSPSRRTRC